MLQPVVRRTWAPLGATPVHKSWGRHDRFTAVAALTVSPVTGRLGLYFDLMPRNLDGEGFFDFLLWLLRRIRRPVVLVIDRLAAHRKGVRLLHEHLGDRADLVRVEWLPAYAPELNPVEQVWGHTKHGKLANYIPTDIDELEETVEHTMNQTREEQNLLRGFIRKTRLQL